MFHVLDRNDIVYSGELSQSTQYVLEHYGTAFDDAIRSGVKILYSDMTHSLSDACDAVKSKGARDFCDPIEDWKID